MLHQVSTRNCKAVTYGNNVNNVMLQNKTIFVLNNLISIKYYLILSTEEARKALLNKIRSEGMSEDDVAKLMSVFDSQGKSKVYNWKTLVFKIMVT